MRMSSCGVWCALTHTHTHTHMFTWPPLNKVFAGTHTHTHTHTHTCEQVFSWGSSEQGQLGLGGKQPSFVPALVPGITTDPKLGDQPVKVCMCLCLCVCICVYVRIYVLFLCVYVCVTRFIDYERHETE